MSVDKLFKALEAPTMRVSCRCICGHECSFPMGLAGRAGRCPSCDRPLRLPGTPTGNTRPGSVFGRLHLEREFKRGTQEPNFAPLESAYVACQSHSMIPGVMYVAATVVLLTLLVRYRDSSSAALALAPARLPAWSLAAVLAIASCMLTAAAVFRRVARRTYVGDRIAFASGGGFDVARWAPLLCFTCLIGAVWLTHLRTQATGGADPLGRLRNPWLLLAVGAALSHLLTAWLAHRVFRARFGFVA